MEHTKPHSSSAIDSLSTAQREQLEHWLFEENLSYREIIQKAQVAFHVRIYHRGLGKFYQQTLPKRDLLKLAGNPAHVKDAVAALSAGWKDSYNALLGAGCQAAFSQAVKSGESADLRIVRDIIKVLTVAKHEDIHIQRLQLDRERFEFNAAEACLKKLPELKLISQNPALTQKEILRQVRIKLFGCAPD